MAYIYPLPKPPVVDTSALTAALDQLKIDDADDDKALADLKKAVEAIVVPDLTDYALKSDIPSAIASTGEVTPVYDPLPAPNPIVTPATLAGATLMANMTGSQLVDNGRVHSFARTTTPPLLAWSGTLTISPVVGACRVRFGVLTAGSWTVDAPGNIDVSINGGTALNARNPGWGWSWTNLNENVYTDGAYTWFDVPIAQSNSPTTVRVQIPTGLGFLPTVYAADAITSLTPSKPTGLKLKDLRSNEEMVYRPSQLALKSEIPAVPDLTPYARKDELLIGNTVADTTALTALQGRPGEIRLLLSDERLYRWAAPIPDRLQTTFPAGTGRNPIPIGTSYWSKFGEWLPFYAEYIQDFGWKRAGTLSETIYGVKLTSGTVTDIEYEFSDPADINVSDYISYSASHIATWTDSTYWGGKTRFESVTLPNGHIVKAITCIRDDGSVILCSQNNAGTATGYVRLVQINGKPADTYPVQIADLDTRIDQLKTAKQDILNWSTTEQLTGRTWTDGKPTYTRTFTGNTPANGNDTRVLQVTGSTKIVDWTGYVVSNGSRKAFMPGMYSGDVNHGSMYQWYNATDLHSYFTFTDTRWNSRPYEITVEYCK